MFVRLRRRVALIGAASFLASVAVTLAGPARPAAALGPALAPIVPVVAADVGAGAVVGCVTSVVCGGVVVVGALGAGAWWAYNNQDKIAEWLGQDTATGGAMNLVPGTGWAWRGTIPPPGSGPYVAYGQTYTTTNNPATDTRPFLVTCINDAGCAVANPATANKRWWCVDTISGQVSASSASEGSNGSTTGPGGVKFAIGSGTVPCNTAYSAVAMVVDVAHGLDWTAAGDWQKTKSYKVTVKCKTPGNDTPRIITKTGTYYSPNGTSGSVPVPGCLDGEYASGVKIESCLAGVCQTITDWNTKTTAEATYPQCLGSAGVLGSCELVVKYQGVACSSSVPECADWYRATVNGSTSYKCWWGPYDIPLSSCKPLRYAYDPGATPGTDGLPSPAPTSTMNPTYSPQPQPSSSPQPTATQSQNAQPTTGTNPSPSATRSIEPFPTTGTGGEPMPSFPPGPVPVPEPPPVPDGQSCMAAAWSWNPIDWVFVPVKCAFIWAFVPDPQVWAQVTTNAQNDWDTSGPGVFAGAAWDALEPIATLGSGVGSSCSGLAYEFPVIPGQPPTEVRFLDACAPPMDGIASIVKAVLTLVVAAYGVYGCVRLLGVGFGWNIGKLPEWEQGSLF